MRKRLRLVALIAIVAFVGAALALFPGQRLPLAFTIATGIGKTSLQQRIDALEDKAIRRAEFSEAEKLFLTDFYRTLATGAKLTVLVRQTGDLMDHYLDGSGDDYRLAPRIFTENAKVQSQMATLRRRAARSQCTSELRFTSPTFYMPDPSNIDSVFGLYYGTVRLVEGAPSNGACTLRWRAEVPWLWPSYAKLKRKYGTFHAESFPLPNLATILLGSKHALFVDNGLGEYLVHLGVAKPFLAFAEWDEIAPREP